ncbi:ATP-binding protein [Erythrobacter sp.]|uniref:sensor histidine kinase n=1 Tax=Erythrobacter sp. TaxID=1042 RepID=UPI001B0FE14D|nr:ATP-binding protein [Erythrobacter sp.]MBO6526813.1 two-component sensor histidine kinase [Erythrobacter sp.]MBO6528486.1 two-component sensor histidine kinase [Erythrobacter sp.]
MSKRSFPWSGFVLAVAACTILATLEIDLVYIGLVLIVWIGSLYLVAARPPEVKEVSSGRAFTRDNMADLFEHSETPVVITERDRVVIANLSARKLLGGHIVGQDVRMALRQPEAIRLLERNAEGGAVVRGLARRTDIWRINRKTLPGELAVIEFVNKTAEADIARAHTDFVANASHELRTPLAAIIGYVETLREDVENLDPKMADKFLGTIQREAKRLQDLVSDLMSLSRIEAEKHDLPEHTLEFAKLAERAAHDAAGGNRSQWLDFEATGEFTIRGDQQQLEQLVRNLVDNGFKYGSPSQPVTVRLHPKGQNRLRMTVTDRGDGISPEHIPHLTRRFYRTDPGRSRASGGTGLGLAIVKHIVERHRGRLDIDSTLGEGTRVTVTLPLEREEAKT